FFGKQVLNEFLAPETVVTFGTGVALFMRAGGLNKRANTISTPDISIYSYGEEAFF
ncbi:hypothetical protein BY996DRAFT_4582737, partial [Phakopsora pachyrhizi]